MKGAAAQESSASVISNIIVGSWHSDQVDTNTTSDFVEYFAGGSFNWVVIRYGGLNISNRVNYRAAVFQGKWRIVTNTLIWHSTTTNNAIAKKLPPYIEHYDPIISITTTSRLMLSSAGVTNGYIRSKKGSLLNAR